MVSVARLITSFQSNAGIYLLQGSVLRIGPALTICCCLRSSMPASYPHILVFSSLIWDYLGINGFWLLMSLLAINNCWFRELHPNIQGPWLHSVLLLSSVQGLWPQCISQFILCSSEFPSTTEAVIGQISALWFTHSLEHWSQFWPHKQISYLFVLLLDVTFKSQVSWK